jgi:Rrf2 family iron-sulfur cluster assembly transcriptional regulator
MLSIGRTSSYAVSALSRLAVLDKPWVQISDLVSATGAPGPYLAKLLYMLTKAGLVNTKRGYKGGYSLARPARDVSVLSIIEAVEGPESLCGCLIGQALCSDERACPAHDFWKTERQNIRDRLANMTLEVVAEFERNRGCLVTPVSTESAKMVTSIRVLQRSQPAKGRKRGLKVRPRARK